VNDREELHRNWVGWVTTNLGRDTRLAEIAATAATDAAELGQGFNNAAEAARIAWADAAKRYSKDHRWWWDGQHWTPASQTVPPPAHGHWRIFGIVALIVVVVAAVGGGMLLLTQPAPLETQNPARQYPGTVDGYPPNEPYGDGGVTNMFNLANSGQTRELLWSDLGSQACPSRTVGIREPDDVSERQLAADLLDVSLTAGVIQFACGGGDVFGYATGTGPRGPFTMGHLAVRPFSLKSGICCQGRNVTFTAGSEAHPGNTWTVVIGAQPGDKA
jgi:hypothetical protein